MKSHGTKAKAIRVYAERGTGSRLTVSFGSDADVAHCGCKRPGILFTFFVADRVGTRHDQALSSKVIVNAKLHASHPQLPMHEHAGLSVLSTSVAGGMRLGGGLPASVG